MTQHVRRLEPDRRPADGRRTPAARPVQPDRPDTRPTDLRRLAAALLSAVLPGGGQLFNRRFALARWLIVPSLLLICVAWLVFQLQSPARLAAWAISPTILQALLILNVLVLGWRLVAVGHAFFDGRYPPVPGRLGFAGLVVLMIAVLAPHAYAWQVGSTAGAAFARIFEGGTIGGGDAAHGPQPGPDERINILIVGIDKTPRRPATLTDTMIVASLDPVGKSISMVSIPRDMVNVPLGNGNDYGPKLNSLYGYAGRNPDEFPKGPMRTLEDAVGALLGIPIHYYARMDFVGFIAMVDAVGGVDVNVKRAFDAPTYDGYGFPGRPRGWSVTKGRHHFTGADALAYARARKADGETDFTRAARQQEIIVALRDRATSGGSLLFDLPDLIDAVGDAARTDIPISVLPELAVTIDEVARKDILQVVIRRPLVKAERTRYGDSQVPRLNAIREMARGLFSEPGTPPTPWPPPEAPS
jgi:LCP family protein required for cell wall assembly